MPYVKKPEKWTHGRHRFARNVMACVLGPASRILYGCKPEKFRQEGKRAYLILFNHQTVFDQFFIGLSFRNPVYFVGTEDLFSMGFISSVTYENAGQFFRLAFSERIVYKPISLFFLSYSAAVITPEVNALLSASNVSSGEALLSVGAGER